MKINVCSIGEAMIEISNIKNSLYNQSFAGDTLNFCNYLDKKKLNAFFLSAIGKSEINQSLLDKTMVKSNFFIGEMKVQQNITSIILIL